MFVPASAPGDQLRIRLVEEKRRFARGEIVEVLAPGAARVEPRCPAVGVCGGCTWQHLDYPAQVAAKRQILRDSMERIGGQRLADAPAMTPSPSPFGYRMRARLLELDGQLGYRALRSHSVCPVGHCPVLAPPLEAALGGLADRIEEGAHGVTGLQGEPDGSEWEIAVGSEGIARASRLGPDGSVELGGETITLGVGARALRISPGTFFQANGLLHAALLEAVTRAVGSGESLLELHAGAGFFTLAVADGFARVQVVESGEGAVRDLRANLSAAGLERVDVVAGRVEEALPQRVHARPDVLLVDPPRAGLGADTVAAIATVSPTRIVYLSCDPATLARDTAELVASGYALQSVEGFDLFPQTPHVEALACFTRVQA